MVKDKDELQLRADEFMDNLASDSEHVKSYFEHPKLDDLELSRNVQSENTQNHG